MRALFAVAYGCIWLHAKTDRGCSENSCVLCSSVYPSVSGYTVYIRLRLAALVAEMYGVCLGEGLLVMPAVSVAEIASDSS